jgi:hypothetical protein
MERGRKSLILFLLAVFGLILTPWAKEYWQAKPFNRWNEQEAMAMLTHSPWSQSSTISENYAGSSPPGSLHMEGGAPTSAPGTHEMGGAPGSSDRGMSSGVGGGNSIPLHIRWCSSQRVRQAMFRLKQLHGNLTEAQEFVKQDMPDYAICISCQVIQPFNTVTLDTIKPRTFLLSKKDKSKKIGLKSYSPPGERQDTQAIFVFPRTLDGKATIELADDEITFVTELGTNKFRGTFKLAKMVVDGQLDLY